MKKDKIRWEIKVIFMVLWGPHKQWRVNNIIQAYVRNDFSSMLWCYPVDFTQRQTWLGLPCPMRPEVLPMATLQTHDLSKGAWAWSQQQFGKGRGRDRQSHLTSRKVLWAGTISHQKPALFIQQRPCTFCVHCHLTIKGLICLCYGNMIVTQTLCSWDFQEFVRKYSQKIYEQILPKRRGPRLRHFFFPLLEQLSNGCWCFPAGWLAPVRKAEIAHLFWLCAPCLPPQGTRKNWRKNGWRLKKQSRKF